MAASTKLSIMIGVMLKDFLNDFINEFWVMVQNDQLPWSVYLVIREGGQGNF